MPQEAFCLKVAKQHCEETIAAVNKLGLTDKRLQIQKGNEDTLYIPLQRQANEEEMALLKAKTPEVQLASCIFLEKKRQEKTLVESLQGLLPPCLPPSLPRALDIVGDIAIVEIPPELEPYKATVGEAILKTHKNVRVALAKAGKVSGTYRLRDFEFIAGEHRTRTVYKENGCSYYVDVAKAYFSPRLSHERERVASLAKEGETVVDLFAGVGPFSILIAKTSKDARIFAVDINPEAVAMLERNASLNRVENRVFPIVGDARKIVDQKLVGMADRVIMNLPETACNFVDVACKAVKLTGGIIHFYGFVRSPDTLENMKSRFSEAVSKTGRKVETFLEAKAVRETAPYECQAVLDAKII
jgi:tRNA (guanine37-N1)-methyltransferase